MCLHGAFADYAEIQGVEEADSIQRKQHRIIARLEREVAELREMGPASIKAKFIDPPETKALVLPFEGTNIHEAIFEAREKAANLVLLDILVEDSKTHLIVRSSDGEICTKLLTWDDSGLTGRHTNINPDCGLALSNDGSLRGRLMDEILTTA